MRVTKIIRSVICAAVSLILMLQSCMTIWAASSVTLNVNDDPAYLCCAVSDILADTAGNSKKAETLYKNKHLMVIGRVESIADNGRKLEISGIDAASVKKDGKLTVTTSDKNIAAIILNLKPNMYVRIFGTGTVSLLSRKATISAKGVETLSDSEAQEAAALEQHLKSERAKGDLGTKTYGFPGGRIIDSSTSHTRSLGGGKMTYLIPEAWAGVETPLTNIEGYMYKLNEIPKEFRTDAEQVYVFYFPLEKYVNSTDRDNPDGIRRAIIKNITRNERVSNLNYPKKKVTSENGRVFEYYDADYVDTSGRSRRAEYVFTDAGTDGIACILYIFSESRHKNDIIYMLGTIGP